MLQLTWYIVRVYRLMALEMSLFHIPHGEMSITLDDVSSLLNLPIKGRLLDHDMINIDDTPEMMVDYYEVGQGDVIKELETILGVHARFRFLERLYTWQMHAT